VHANWRKRRLTSKAVHIFCVPRHAHPRVSAEMNGTRTSETKRVKGCAAVLAGLISCHLDRLLRCLNLADQCHEVADCKRRGWKPNSGRHDQIYQSWCLTSKCMIKNAVHIFCVGQRAHLRASAKMIRIETFKSETSELYWLICVSETKRVKGCAALLSGLISCHLN